MSDTVSDMLNRIRTANHKMIESIEMPSSKLKVEIAKVLKEEGFISGYRVVQEKGFPALKLNLKYTPARERVIQGLKRISRPGLRIYRSHDNLPSVQNGLGTAIISTSKGVTSGQKARESKLGGEVLCFVW